MKRRFDMKKSVLPEQEQQEELVVEEPQQKKGHIFVVATFFAKSTYIYIATTIPFSNKRFMLDEMTLSTLNISKFAIFLEYEMPCVVFSFRATFFLCSDNIDHKNKVAGKMK